MGMTKHPIQMIRGLREPTRDRVLFAKTFIQHDLSSPFSQSGFTSALFRHSCGLVRFFIGNP
jgi:hypothetical protein